MSWRGERRKSAPDAYLRALMAVLDGDESTAEAELTEALHRDSSGIESYLALARLFRRRGEVGRAIRIHQNLLLRRDLGGAQRVRVLDELGRDFARGGFLQRAIAAFEEVVEHDAKHEHALSELVRLLADAGDHAGAITRAKRLARVRRTPDPALESDLLCRMAHSCLASGEVDAARKAAKRAVRRAPDNALAHVLLGRAEVERGKNKAALECWKSALAVVSSEDEPALADEILTRLEASCSALDRVGDTAGLLRDHLTAHPADAAARLALARHLASHDAPDEAQAELETLLSGHPGHLGARIALGRVLLSQGRDAEAGKQYAELLGVLERQERAERADPIDVAPPATAARRTGEGEGEGP